jgi:hypothetical protein
VQLDQEPWENRDDWQEQEPGRPRRVPDSRVDGVASAPGPTVPPRSGSLASGHWAHGKDVAATASTATATAAKRGMQSKLELTAGMRMRVAAVFELWVDDDVHVRVYTGQQPSGSRNYFGFK